MSSAQRWKGEFEALPADLREAREPLWQKFAETGLPSRKIERFHYTDLSALEPILTAPGGGKADKPERLEGATVALFVDGIREDAPPAPPEARLSDDGVTLLNAALVRDGLNLDVEAKATPAPVQLIRRISSAGTSHLRHRIRLQRQADVTLVLDLSGNDAEHLLTEVLEIELEAGSRLRLYRLQDDGVGTTALSRTDVRIGRDATFEYVGLDLGSQLTRHDLNVVLAEPGASTTVRGVYAPGGKTHCDTHTRIIHAAPNGSSRELFRGLVRDAAHAVYNGMIKIEKGAQKTDSEQHVASLLLSPKAQVNAKPELEIYADDVKAAHGCTCGQLDEDAVYYLRTRGLDRESARNLLMFTFAREAFADITWEVARKWMEGRLLSRLPGGEAWEELV